MAIQRRRDLPAVAREEDDDPSDERLQHMTMPFNSLLYLPTHRPARRAIEQGLLEAAWANRQAPDTTLFCLIEHGLAKAQTAAHRAAIAANTHATATPWLQIDDGKAVAFVDRLLSRLGTDSSAEDRLKQMLLPAGLSYGRGPNLAALLAMAIGCQLVHRRDSDVFIDEAHPEPLPIAMELEVVGRSLASVSDRVRLIDEFDAASVATVRAVGTSSFGSLTLDRRDLIIAGLEFLVQFQQLGRPGTDRGSVESEAIQYFIDAPAVRYAESFFEIDIANRVEMEACCFAGVYRHIPEMPTDIIGCDYMAKDAVWRSRDGLVFHSRKVRHEYEPAREEHADESADCGYVLRDVMYLQMGRIWQKHSQQMEPFWSSHRGIECFDSSVYADSFIEAAGASGPALAEVREGAARIYAAAAAASRGSVATRLRAAAEAIDAAGSSLDDHVRNAVSDYSLLVSEWSRLCEAASEVAIPYSWFGRDQG